MTTLSGQPFSAQRSNLSAGDVSVVNALYPEGFLDVFISGPSRGSNIGIYTWNVTVVTADNAQLPYTYKWEIWYSRLVFGRNFSKFDTKFANWSKS